MRTVEFRKRFKGTPFNPESRTLPANLKILTELMKKYGFWAHKPITVVGDTIGDGNRRLRAAELAGVEYVYFVRAEGISVDALYADGNGSAQAHSTKQVGEAIQRGLTEIPPSRSKSVLLLLDACNGDWAEMKRIIGKGVSPGMMNLAARCANTCGFTEKDAARNEFLVRVLLWMSEHHNTQRVKQALNGGMSGETLFQKVAENKDIQLRFR